MIELEKELIERCRANDKAAFGSLINKYRKQLFSYLLRMCEDRMQAEDLFQETLIRVWKGISNYKEQNKFSSWIFSIAHNVTMDNIRSKKVREKGVHINENINAVTVDNPHSVYVANETKEIIMHGINELPEKQKQVFLLRQHSNMSFKEIAAATNQPLNTVLGHMHYAVSKLRKMLSEEYE